ncbi:hypothetical protein NMU03_13700 [Allocoprobacillus halotolerans]|uniref:Uncharacterized protein n=1 Tax=Allocoprobacillus halotolerans TaxID=2944914 RepID=A0ABY5I811_9FIRM|nr:hypothetical protein [Allocoprobacillus halotolerans]UTY40927.1 hypothetical protein NMU03_13700 [Allocoprobacillus halotolerans]
MKVYSIEELHLGFIDQTIDISSYYQELYQETIFQQNRCHAFVTITNQIEKRNFSRFITRWYSLCFKRQYQYSQYIYDSL